MWRYNTYIDWAAVPPPVIPACLHDIDGKAPLRRSADLDLKVAVHSQTISSLLALLQGAEISRIEDCARCIMDNN